MKVGWGSFRGPSLTISRYFEGDNRIYKLYKPVFVGFDGLILCMLHRSFWFQ
jgi:hypothetical protein